MAWSRALELSGVSPGKDPAGAERGGQCTDRSRLFRNWKLLWGTEIMSGGWERPSEGGTR